MDDGAVTAAYGADRETVLKLLNDSLATEIVCTLRYKRHYFMAKGIHSEAVAQEFARARDRGAGTRRHASPSASSNWAASRISRPTVSRRARIPSTRKARI